MNRKRVIKIFIVLVLLGILVINIKSIFVDYCADSGYALAMAQRLIDGDGLFIKAWEPHQTSAFVIALLMKVYEAFFHTKTGIVLYVHLCGLLLYAVVALALYFLLKEYIGSKASGIAAAIILVLRPKMVQLPDYANLIIIFSVMMFVFLARYLLKGKRILDLIVSSLFLVLCILSYPSCITLYVGMIVLLIVFSEKKVRDVLISTATCAVSGIAYAMIPVSRLGFWGFIDRLLLIVKSDSHSEESTYTGINYFKEVLYGLVVLLITAVISLMIYLLIRKLKRIPQANFIEVFSVVSATLFCIESVIIKNIIGDPNIAYWCVDKVVVLIPIAISLFYIRKIEKERRTIYVISMVLSMCTLVGIGLLTNLPLITVLCYSHLALVGAMVVLSGMKRKLIPMVCTLLALIVVQGMSSVTTIENIVRVGPKKGIVTTLYNCNYERISFAEWNENVGEDDSVLIADSFRSDPLLYIYTGAKVGTSSTISTPSLSETLQEYWEMYPDREPAVIAVPVLGGEESGKRPDWIEDKIDKNYTLRGQGEYWNFYRKKQ